jgi:hypothetical protein
MIFTLSILSTIRLDIKKQENILVIYLFLSYVSTICEKLNSNSFANLSTSHLALNLTQL